MTADEYRTLIRSWGLTAVRVGQSNQEARFGNEVLHQDRDGHCHRITDPDTLSADERVAMIAVYRLRLGIMNS